MKYLSVCSGIEAASVAWHSLGWTPVAFSEIESAPCKVLAHHFPEVPNLGDMTKYKDWPDYEIDLLVGGTPCQSFSVAGLRKGLDDPRGNLMLTYLGIADRYKPKWLLWENVPGVLSSNRGRDFGTFLGALGELGYGFAYRILDAQYCRTYEYYGAVPQRRRRVFVVGCLGDWASAAAVLFDSESLRGNPPPSRRSGQTIAARFGSNITGGGRRIDTYPCGGIGSYNSGDVSSPLLRTGADLGPGCETIIMSHGQSNAEISVGFAPTLNCNHEQPIAIVGNIIGRSPENGGNGIGFDQSGDMHTLTKTDIHAIYMHPHAVAFHVDAQPDEMKFTEEHTSTLTASQHVGVMLRTKQYEISCECGWIFEGILSDPCPVCGMIRDGATNDLTLLKSHSHVVAFGMAESPDLAHCLRSGASRADKHESTTYVVTTPIGFSVKDDGRGTGDISPTICNQHTNAGIAYAMQVRRLIPLECERLQGFPDNWTNVLGMSDTARYKALGNSMAVNVMQLLGQRIQMVNDFLLTESSTHGNITE